jgi:nucleotidyltransferase substrate binding protein (TIGR01987 family)
LGKLKQKVAVAERAIDTLNTILGEEYSKIIRDASIQRFEYTFESVWKALKVYLNEREGIVANSPKTVFRELQSIRLLTEEETQTALEMVDDRNLTTHTYIEELAETIFRKLPDYEHLMQQLLKQIQ